MIAMLELTILVLITIFAVAVAAGLHWLFLKAAFLLMRPATVQRTAVRTERRATAQLARAFGTSLSGKAARLGRRAHRSPLRRNGDLVRAEERRVKKHTFRTTGRRAQAPDQAPEKLEADGTGSACAIGFRELEEGSSSMVALRWLLMLWGSGSLEARGHWSAYDHLSLGQHDGFCRGQDDESGADLRVRAARKPARKGLTLRVNFLGGHAGQGFR